MCHARQGSEQMAAAAQGIEDHSREQLMDRKTGLRSPLGQLGPALRQDGGLSTQILVERPMLSWPRIRKPDTHTPAQGHMHTEIWG